jgi:hypothetical protein
LYPLKRSIESAQVSLNSSDAAKGEDLVNQASTRLDEIDGLMNHGDSTAEITHTLASFKRSAADGADLLFVAYQRDGDSDVLANLRGTLSEQTTLLNELTGQAPSTVQPDFASARALLSDLDQQARVLCGNCGPDDGSDFTKLSSTPALESLLTRPAQSAVSDQLANQAKSLADKANQIAESTPKAPTTLPGDSTTRGGTQTPSVQVPNLQNQTAPLKGTVTTVTGGVQGLLDSVNTTTGGILTPVTEPVDNTLDAITSLLLGP